MITAQAIADLALQLAPVTGVEQADAAIRRALRAAGLLHAPTVDEADLQRLVAALAAEGGPVEQLAIHVAIHGLGGTTEGLAPPR